MQPDGFRTMKLDTMCEGAATELFDAALAQVLDNIEDPMTDPKMARVITLKIILKPLSDERRSAVVSVECSAKTAGVRPVRSTVAIGRHDGQMVAVEAMKQEELFPSPAGRPTGLVATNPQE